MLVEVRIPMPLTVEEYKRAQIFTVSKVSRAETHGHEGVELVVNEPYVDEASGTSGQYTHKIIHLSSRVPTWLTYVLPTKCLQIHERSWNAYPICRTEYSIPFLGEKFQFIMVTIYRDGAEVLENVHDLSAEELAERQLELVDIVNDPIAPTAYKPEEDLLQFVSTVTGRGPVASDWLTNPTTPMMYCYKLCRIKFSVFGLQSRIENLIVQRGIKDTVRLAHRQAVAWIDEWYNLTFDQIREIEAQLFSEAKQSLADDRQQASSSSSSSSSASSAPSADPAQDPEPSLTDFRCDTPIPDAQPQNSSEGGGWLKGWW